jgi:hypothetical protein
MLLALPRNLVARTALTDRIEAPLLDDTGTIL